MATETMGEHRGGSAERDGAGASAGRPVLVHHVVARDGDKGLEVLRIPLEGKGETLPVFTAGWREDRFALAVLPIPGSVSPDPRASSQGGGSPPSLTGEPRQPCSVLSGVATSKQQRGLSPRSQRSWTGTPATSATKVSAMRQTSGCSGVTAASGQL